MVETGRRALTACRSAGAAHRALAALGLRAIAYPADGMAALEALDQAQPDVAVVDAILPGLDGAGFLERVRRLKLAVQPAVLILKPKGLALPGEAGLALKGALAADADAGAESLRGALETLLERPVPLPPEKSARLGALLDALGIPAHPGRSCLSHAVALAWADRRLLDALRAALYPRAAQLAGVTPAQCERAIRHVIDLAFRSGEIEAQHRIFGDTIDARRGKPTSGEMIAQLADILRWEG